MTVSTCPADEVKAPLGAVWDLLQSSAPWGGFWDVRVLSVEPEGRATPGQKILGQSRAVGRQWPVVFRVEALDHAKSWMEVTTSLPLGMAVKNRISCHSLCEEVTLVRFG